MKQTKKGIGFLHTIFLPYNFSPNPQLYIKHSTTTKWKLNKNNENFHFISSKTSKSKQIRCVIKMGHYTHLFIYRLILCLLSKILQSIYKIKGFFFFILKFPTSHWGHTSREWSWTCWGFWSVILITHFILKKIEQN